MDRWGPPFTTNYEWQDEFIRCTCETADRTTLFPEDEKGDAECMVHCAIDYPKCVQSEIKQDT